MRAHLLMLMGVQLLGIMGSVFAAFVEIGTIVLTGSVFSVVGLEIALLCYRRRLVIGLYFGLSVPTISVLCTAIVFGLQWGQTTAAVPISCLLVVFAVIAVPLGILAIREIVFSEGVERQTRLRFGISTLLGLMALVAVVLGLVRMGSTIVAAIGIFGSYVAVCYYFLRRFHRESKQREATWADPATHQSPA